MQHFHRLTIIIDLVGVIGVILATIGFYFTHLTSSETAQLFGNLGIELIGSWISVRILEFILRTREQYRSTRTQILRNLRWHTNFTRRMRSNITSADIESLLSEISFSTHVFTNRKKYLQKSEIEICNKAFDCMQEFADKAEIAYGHILDVNHSTSLIQDALKRYIVTNTPFPNEKAAKIAFSHERLAQISRSITQSEIRNASPYLQELASLQSELSIDNLDLREELIVFFDAAKLAIASKVEISAIWDKYSSLVAEAENDIREETPES